MVAHFFEYVSLFILLIALLIAIADRLLRAEGYRGPVSDHFDGATFRNIKDQPVRKRSHGFGSALRWSLSRKKNAWETRAVRQAKPEDRVPGAGLVATFINHATVLIQTEGFNIITDPVYAERASPFSFLGPRRFASPGVAFDDLPKIDLVLISHNHYDHLDIATLKRLVARDNPRILVPLGNAVFLAKRGIRSGVELDWWQSDSAADNISVVCVPAQHFSARALSDRNKTLWCGYVIRTPHGDLYFAGDTGFGPFVDRIAEQFSKGFRFGLLPIGAFRPEWFMKEVHVSPDEAFAMQERLAIQDVLAIHFGTFKLADDTQDEPAERVRELARTIPASRRFLALVNGGSMEVR